MSSLGQVGLDLLERTDCAASFAVHLGETTTLVSKLAGGQLEVGGKLGSLLDGPSTCLLGPFQLLTELRDLLVDGNGPPLGPSTTGIGSRHVLEDRIVFPALGAREPQPAGATYLGLIGRARNPCPELRIVLQSLSQSVVGSSRQPGEAQDRSDCWRCREPRLGGLTFGSDAQSNETGPAQKLRVEGDGV